MAEEKMKVWWFGSSKNDVSTPSRRSPWLHSTLAELEEKTKAMLSIVEEDADSFAQRAEMYYKKRPELITMVEEFYRTHRSLAERFDQLKSDPCFRLISPWSPSPLSFKSPQMKLSMTCSDKSYDSYSETYDPMELCESDVDDPEQEQEEYEIVKKMKENEDEEVAKLKGEIERLEEENRIQKERLVEKDEEKREVIRQLSVAIDAIKEENLKLRKFCVAKETPKKSSPSEFHKLKGMFMGKLFKVSSN